MTRLRLRFRLKHLMLFTAAVACALGCLVWLGDFGKQRWVSRVHKPEYKLLLAKQAQRHFVAFFEADDEQLVFFFKRLSGKSSFSANWKILDAKGNSLQDMDDGRGVEHVALDDGLIRELADEALGNDSPVGYRYPIRRGYRGNLRFQYFWDYIDRKQKIVLDVTVPWREETPQPDETETAANANSA